MKNNHFRQKCLEQVTKLKSEFQRTFPDLSRYIDKRDMDEFVLDLDNTLLLLSRGDVKVAAHLLKHLEDNLFSIAEYIELHPPTLFSKEDECSEKLVTLAKKVENIINSL